MRLMHNKNEECLEEENVGKFKPCVAIDCCLRSFSPSSTPPLSPHSNAQNYDGETVITDASQASVSGSTPGRSTLFWVKWRVREVDEEDARASSFLFCFAEFSLNFSPFIKLTRLHRDSKRAWTAEEKSEEKNAQAFSHLHFCDRSHKKRRALSVAPPVAPQNAAQKRQPPPLHLLVA